MALGDTTNLGGDLKYIECLANATAANSPPSGASAGLDVQSIKTAFSRIPRICEFLVDNSGTTESGVMSVLLRRWDYLGATIGWVPWDNGFGGYLNKGRRIAETGSDTIKHREVMYGLDRAQRVYIEIVSIGGTNTGITCYLADRQTYGVAEAVIPPNPLGILYPASTDSEYLAVTTSAQDITTAMLPGEIWVYTSNVDTYIEQAASPTAAASDGSMLVPAGCPVVIKGDEGAELSVLGLVAGVATLAKMKML